MSEEWLSPKLQIIFKRTIAQINSNIIIIGRVELKNGGRAL